MMLTDLTLGVLRNLLPFSRYPYRGQIVSCPVCQRAEHRKLASLDRRLKRLSTVVCNGCGLFFTNPMPSDSELTTYYERYYRFDYQMNAGAPKTRHVVKRRREAEKRFNEIKGQLPTRARTLDFGAGSGEFVLRLLDAGHDAYGFEPGEGYGQYAQEKLKGRFQLASWQDVAYHAEFDLVTCFHVLEHLNDPLAALQRASQWLKPEGLLFIEVPNSLRWFGDKGFGSFHFAHVVGFNRFNLELAAAKAGLVATNIISPTSIVFQRSSGRIDVDALARSAMATTESTLQTTSPVSAFVRHKMRKFSMIR